MLACRLMQMCLPALGQWGTLACHAIGPARVQRFIRKIVFHQQTFVTSIHFLEIYPKNIPQCHEQVSFFVYQVPENADLSVGQELSLDFRVQLAKLIIALSRRDEAEVVRLDKEMGSRTQLGKADVRLGTTW